MFDWVRNNRRVAQVLLALIMVPFAFWGLQSFDRSMMRQNTVASIGDQEISQEEFEREFAQRLDRVRDQLGAQFRREQFDTPEARKEVLRNLIERRLVTTEVVRANLFVSDDAVRDKLFGFEQLQEEGKFSTKRYDLFLRGQGRDRASFEELLRHELRQDQLVGGMQSSAITSRLVAERFAALSMRKLDVQEAPIRPDDYMEKARPAPGAAEAFYKQHQAEFVIPEQAKLEYVVASLDSVSAGIPLEAGEAEKYYQANIGKYSDEQRRARHILIDARKDASAAEKAAAQKKADGLLAELRKDRGKFASLAKQHSGDSGSAEQGGDLGFFGRGMMVTEFENAVFSMKVGEISTPVLSEHGYHIIQLDAIKPGKTRSFEEARGEIEGALKRDRALKKFSEVAAGFTDMVEDQAESLQPVVDKFGLKLERSDWVAKKASPQAGILNNPKLLDEVFSDSVLNKGYNTKAVDLGQNVLISARVVDKKAARQQALAEVLPAINLRLLMQGALDMAITSGKEKLEKLQKGEAVNLPWSAARKVGRDAEGVDPLALRAIFNADLRTLPAYVGVELPQRGYALYRINSVVAGPVGDADINAVRKQLAGMYGEMDVTGFIEALRDGTEVKIDESKLRVQPSEQ
jgi:peptidyl-prolyl cis-trans isomerase D